MSPRIGLIVDNFAGGGGASLGIEMANWHGPDIAINHDPVALGLHAANHPHTRHLVEDVWAIDPRAVTAGRHVALAWFSPDCKHFSKAKGGQPVEKKIRGLAWVVVRWAVTVRPTMIALENVEEFQDWGPLKDAGTPCRERRGRTFRLFVDRLRQAGYDVAWRELKACDYGAPTIRKRLFLIARCDGAPIRWPEPTHAAPGSLDVKLGLRKPWRSAAECIDWSLPCPSIFGRDRPLAGKTLARIARGVKRFVTDAAEPFIVPVTHGGDLRAHAVTEPLRTVTGADVREPFPTILSGGGRGGHHVGEVRAFLMKYYGTGGQHQDCREPMHTATAKARLGLVTVAGVDYQIVDIGMRMLSPRELFRAQGFPEGYIIDRLGDGTPISKTDQIRLCGNSVSPPVARAILEANFSNETLSKAVAPRRRARLFPAALPLSPAAGSRLPAADLSTQP